MSNMFDEVRKADELYKNNSLTGYLGSAVRGMFGLGPREGADAVNQEISRIGQIAMEAGGPAGMGMLGAGAAAKQLVSKAKMAPNQLRMLLGASSEDPVVRRTLEAAATIEKKRGGGDKAVEAIVNVNPRLSKLPSGQWAYEISDAGAKIKLPDNLPTGNVSLNNLSEGKWSFEGKLGDVLEHPELFKSYPFLKNVQFKFSKQNPDKAGMAGYHRSGRGNPENAEIAALREDTLPDTLEDIKSTVLHEVQHAIQAVENWPAGMNERAISTGDAAVKRIATIDKRLQDWNNQVKKFPDMAKSAEVQKNIRELAAERAILDKVWRHYPNTDKGRRQAYLDSYGERQARGTQARRNMTDAEIKTTPRQTFGDMQIDQYTRGRHPVTGAGSVDFDPGQKSFPQGYTNDYDKADYDTAITAPFNRILRELDDLDSIGDTTR
jgi:hypothetical protein